MRKEGLTLSIYTPEFKVKTVAGYAVENDNCRAGKSWEYLLCPVTLHVIEHVHLHFPRKV